MVDQIRHSGDVRVLDEVENLSQGGHHRRDLLDVIFEIGVEARANWSRALGLRTRQRGTSASGTTRMWRTAAHIGDGVLKKITK